MLGVNATYLINTQNLINKMRVCIIVYIHEFAIIQFYIRYIRAHTHTHTYNYVSMFYGERARAARRLQERP